MTSTFKLSSKHCSTCNVPFDSEGVWRAHSKSPWHVENLRRRVAGLDAVDASTFQASGSTLAPQTRDDYSEEELEGDHASSSSDDSGDEVAPEEAPEFSAAQCLFCPERSDSLDNNVDHMQKTHGLLIKNIGNLIVDLETLVRYLHLVIFQDRECLYCHSQRRTAEAAQQHMIGKGHCKIDIESPDSEYRDFFDFGADELKDRTNGPLASTNPDGETVDLPSGKTIASRIAAPPQKPKHRNSSATKARETAFLEAQPDDQKSTPPNTVSSQALSRSEKREASLTDQLATLSINDRMSLAHLPSSEQRSVLATRKKQMDRARRIEQRYRSRLEIMGNRTLQHHFVEDVRAGKLMQY